ncbi:superoxide dismutase [Streptomyces cinnamoneus]|uniref:Superoxide dismutase n=1 Tax=Streptomyces cinnamoneus TaxID=53446 RepID=A0A2G1XGC6_STRCJ|nr:superoxide dismutase family protein [Streptomyces cinnamoneus]PHQ50255.1 superoxide dismutase [Streptomyces cinnamoneus]PPT12959.1 superoxide dismutase [Streptomyces cinnamoneus]
MSFVTSAIAASMLVASPTSVQCQGVAVSEWFEPAAGGGVHAAVTFRADVVPDGARVTVVERTGHDGTHIALRLHGVEAGRTFGAHVHTKPCGAKPEDSGPHYQDRKDPKQPSTDPAYANPRNEVWLDLTTDRRGDGGASADVQWRFRDGEARSVVVHEHATETGAGHAGMAGARLACVNVPFV